MKGVSPMRPQDAEDMAFDLVRSTMEQLFLLHEASDHEPIKALAISFARALDEAIADEIF